MEFKNLLNKYCRTLDCTNQQLADLSGLSKSLISRYRNGERTPDMDGDGLKKLSEAIESIAKKKAINLEENVYESMKKLLMDLEEDKKEQSDSFSENLDYILNVLNISNSDMARVLNVDSSFISRIRNKRRRVNNVNEMAHNCSEYIYNIFCDSNSAIFEELFHKEKKEFESKRDFINLLIKWMTCNKKNISDSISNFLCKLDEFDLNDYIKAIHFDTLKVPISPITLPTSQKYYGIKKMKEGTVDFLKATVLSRKTDDVYIMSDMPMEKMAEDVEFGKKWMGGLALIIKKGIHLNVIHCLDRPFIELMLGLESWIPLYMTGQISSYYFKNQNNKTMSHLNYTSGVAALFGECVSGYQDEGMYYLTKKKDEVEYYRKRSERLLQKADSLMSIYRKEHIKKYRAYMEKLNSENANRRNILSSPPLYTIPDDIIINMLNRTKYNQDKKEEIIRMVKKVKNDTLKSLENNSINDFISIVTKEEFMKKPIKLQLSILCVECELEYNWEEYKEHIETLKRYNEENSNYSFIISEERWYNNIQIMMYIGKVAIISKNNSPIINFVIEYPKLRNAIENMVLPVKE